MDEQKRGPGRPKKAAEVKILNVKLDSDMHDAVRMRADKMQVTITAVVESALRAELRRA